MRKRRSAAGCGSPGGRSGDVVGPQRASILILLGSVRGGLAWHPVNRVRMGEELQHYKGPFHIHGLGFRWLMLGGQQP